MGLDTSHDCWHGAYSSFNNWRRALCEVAGYGDLNDFFEARNPWPDNGDVLFVLLDHSDCDGWIEWQHCKPLAARLETLIDAMRRKDFDGYLGQKTDKFIEGLLRAHDAHEDVEFH